jgi:nitroimidazol reductase NimA-like FMN-containing flavoprotein (pyridoxamine 5'-phosphate oxidase superfamily)
MIEWLIAGAIVAGCHHRLSKLEKQAKEDECYNWICVILFGKYKDYDAEEKIRAIQRALDRYFSGRPHQHGCFWWWVRSWAFDHGVPACVRIEEVEKLFRKYG